MKQELRVLHAELHAKRQRAEILEQEFNQASLEEKKAEKLFHQALDRYAKDECLILCDMMYRRLPCGLRDLVYQYLCIEDQPIPVGPYYHFREYERKAKPKSSLDRQRDDLHLLGISTPTEALGIESEMEMLRSVGDSVLLPDGRMKYDHSEMPPAEILMPGNHVFNPRYVGKAIAYETQKYYYSNNTFSLCNLEGGIRSFLRIEEFDGVAPCNAIQEELVRNSEIDIRPWNVVRDLQIRIKYEHFDALLEFAMDSPTAREQDAYEHNFLKCLREPLEVIPLLPAKELKIEFILMTAFAGEGKYAKDQERRLTNLLQTIRNTVYKLMYDRNHTSVRVIHHDSTLSPFPRDLTRLWSLTQDQWAYERSTNQGKSDWTAAFYVGLDSTGAENASDGFSSTEIRGLLRERWGINNALKDTTPRWPIAEGRYWPVRNRWVDDAK